ncbi:DtxR family transcriptional regulator [Thermodesulfobacteriota bacterium]
MVSSKGLPKLTSAMEDYLEAIYHLEQEKRIARVRDIANRLHVKMSSVSSALKSLSSSGMISYDPHQYIILTDKGMEKAKEIVRRHETLKSFLTKVLSINEETAEENACRMEHHLEPDVMEKLVRFVEFVEMCPVDQTRWVDGVSESCDNCISCLEKAREKVSMRAKAQKAALAEGMTLGDASEGDRIFVEAVKGPAKFKRQMAEEGLEHGVMAQILTDDPDADKLHLKVKGYHIALRKDDASKILVKPF